MISISTLAAANSPDQQDTDVFHRGPPEYFSSKISPRVAFINWKLDAKSGHGRDPRIPVATCPGGELFVITQNCTSNASPCANLQRVHHNSGVFRAICEHQPAAFARSIPAPGGQEFSRSPTNTPHSRCLSAPWRAGPATRPHAKAGTRPLMRQRISCTWAIIKAYDDLTPQRSGYGHG